MKNYIETLLPGSNVLASVKAYLYGDNEIVTATAEEVAYMAMRLQARPDFLESRCKAYANIDFSFTIE